VEMQNDQSTRSKSLKEKTTKAERRALQEAQRAAKAAAKGEYSSIIFFGHVNLFFSGAKSLFYRCCLELVMFNYHFLRSDVLIFCFGYEQMEFFFLILFCLVFMLSNFSWNK